MFKRTTTYSYALLFAASLLAASCSDKKATPSTSETTALELADLEGIIRAVAPPEFVAPAGSPSEIDSIWFTGTSPLLDKVFGSRDPQCLYSNINEFKQSMEIFTSTLRVNANGDIITGVYVDSHLVAMEAGDTMMHFTATITALPSATPMLADAQAVIGDSVDVDFLVRVQLQEKPDGIVNIGLKISDSAQTIIQFDSGMGNSTDTETRLIYANLNPIDSTFTFRGVGFCMHDNGDKFNYAFNISSEANSDFAYRVSWYSNGTPGTDLLNTIVGGGNKDTEFALKYRMFIPADTTVCDTNSIREQVFGPNYTEGTGLISAYAQYLDDALVFLNNVVPATVLGNPWEE